MHAKPEKPTIYRNLATGRTAKVTTETEGPRRCHQRVEMHGDGTLEITWRPTYGEACGVAAEFVK